MMEIGNVNYSSDELHAIYNDFFENGFFSEYLPPCFSLDSNYGFSKLALSEKMDYIQPIAFNMSRFSEKGKRRTVFIPEFTSYLRVINFIKANRLLEDLLLCAQSKHSFSPLIRSNKQITRHEQEYSRSLLERAESESQDGSNYVSNVLDKLRFAKGACGILSLDIANFYSSIYTHFIPCIKFSYDEANRQYLAQKADNKDPSISEQFRVYEQLDSMVRGMNLGRTNGLLPGTLISQFIAEALLCRIEQELEAAGIRFVRFVDDYEIFVYNDDDIENLQNSFSSVLGKYSFSLNNEKTKYTSFPYYVIDDLAKLLPDNNEAYTPVEIASFFDRFFILEQKGTKGAIRFLIKSINPQISKGNVETITTYLINVLVNDPRSLIKTCELIISLKDQLKLAEGDKALIETLILDQVSRNNQLESIWLIYLRLNLFETTIPQGILNAIVESPNELAKVMIIENCWNYLTRDIQETFCSSECSWLLGYQLFLHDYINKCQFQQSTGVNHSFSYYNQLKRKGVSFYANKL